MAEWAKAKAEELAKGYAADHLRHPLVESIAKALREAHSAGMDEMMKMVKQAQSEEDKPV